MNLKFPQVAISLLLALPFATLYAADPLDDLEAFRKKLAAPQTPREDTARALQDLTTQVKALQTLLVQQAKQPGAARDLPQLAMQIEVLQNLIARQQRPPDAQREGTQLAPQIKMLQSLIAREDYDRALQIVESLGGYGLPAEFQDDWMALSEKLSKELEKKKARSFEKASREIDQLVKDTKQGCLSAKTSTDLDSLLLRCSAFQIRSQRSGSVMSERISRKLQGINNTLSQWADYLDFKDAGNAKSANERLRNLFSNSSDFPVLSAADIETHFLPEPGSNSDSRTVIAGIFKDVKSPDELPVALERLQAIIRNPLYSSNYSLGNEQSRIEACIQAWKAAQVGDVAEVYQALSRVGSGSEETQAFYTPFKTQIEEKLLLGKTAAWTTLKLSPGENPASYLGRVLDELKAKGDYVTIVEVLDLSNRLNRDRAPSDARACIQQYLAGKRLEDAGDGLSAITNYRRSVAMADNKYAPTFEAQEALKRLQKKYPDAFTGQDAILSEQIRMLSEQIQALSNQMRSVPMRPGRPY